MRIDFYQLGRDPVPKVAALLARATLAAGERLLICAENAQDLAQIDAALWSEHPQDFLAHGNADRPHAARQPILLASKVAPANAARFVMLADGRWREGLEDFDRVFLLFGEDTLADARMQWKRLGSVDNAERHFWRQQGGRWVEGP